ncbi:uncharacterized protein CLUP02_03164 [Colletotrichum lupini]|uniref:Uncharacterized protein n=1 Tax=Colletotrichum lupini TaxID=145971 RepID=A0A9Q8WBI9_9PEZI|nr:uncharacterized protein CLUP02_03164 [Colletotrichum lupini]UQC77693.1 hypothetical protein CLUP02_03164 [Colletotrichum lupini]
MSQRSSQECSDQRCRWQPSAGCSLRRHILYHHGPPGRAPCGRYHINTGHYLERHKESCVDCKSMRAAAEALMPSVEHDGGDDPEGAPEGNHRALSVHNGGITIHGSNYGKISLKIKCGSLACAGGQRS